MHRRLLKQHGPVERKPRLPIIDELILTLLSQNTSDVNRDRAFAGLRARFKSWEEVLDAPEAEIATSIRSGGIAQVKAARMKAILDAIEEREGKLDLSRLKRLSDQEVSDYLISLPGVGAKTVACVLAFSMGRDAFPIDTHVHRVTRRLGWIGEKTSADRAHQELGSAVPADLRYELHMLLIDHGRRICTARMPRCSECVLFDVCDSGPRLLASGVAR